MSTVTIRNGAVKARRDAMRALNKVHAGMRANYRALDAAKAALLALGVSWEAV